MSDALYRLLILTASTGGGHDARADALCAWAREIYGELVEIKVLRPLEGNRTPIGRFGVELYNFIQRHAPILHHVYFPVIEVVGDVQGDFFFGRAEYEKTLKDFRPQMILSLHDFLNKGYFDLAHQMFGDKVRCVTYCGEYSAGSGFSKHWVSPQSDRWIGRTEGALREAYRLGANPDALERFTFFLPPDEVAKISPPPSRKAMRLDNTKLTILMASGRNGAVDHLSYLKALEPYKDKIQAIVVCGLNERMRQAVEGWQHETQFPMIVEGYSMRMRTYTQMADVMLFKGGANTATRAFFEGCPMWFDASEGIMPQEKLTVDFFVKAGAGELIHSPKDLAAKVASELRSPGRIATMRTKIQELRDKYADPKPDEFFDKLFRWGFARDEQARRIMEEEIAESGTPGLD